MNPQKIETNKITQGCVYIIQEKLPCKLHITEKLCKKYDWYYGKNFKALFRAQCLEGRRSLKNI